MFFATQSVHFSHLSTTTRGCKCKRVPEQRVEVDCPWQQRMLVKATKFIRQVNACSKVILDLLHIIDAQNIRVIVYGNMNVYACVHACHRPRACAWRWTTPMTVVPFRFSAISRQLASSSPNNLSLPNIPAQTSFFDYRDLSSRGQNQLARYCLVYWKAVVDVQPGKCPQTGPEKITILSIEGSVLQGKRKEADEWSR